MTEEKKPSPRHTGRRSTRARRTAEKRRIFLDALAKGRSVGGAAAAAGVSRRTPYKWRKSAKFAKDWDEHEDMGTDLIEDAATRRAVDGVKRPVFQQGRKVGEVTEYSDHMTAILLKARRPEKYREKAGDVNVGVKVVTERKETKPWAEMDSMEKHKLIASVNVSLGEIGRSLEGYGLKRAARLLAAMNDALHRDGQEIDRPVEEEAPGRMLALPAPVQPEREIEINPQGDDEVWI
jgi:hypothetical protein